LRREAIAIKGGETENEKKLYSLLGTEMKILITDQRVLLGKSDFKGITGHFRLIGN